MCQEFISLTSDEVVSVDSSFIRAVSQVAEVPKVAGVVLDHVEVALSRRLHEASRHAVANVVGAKRLVALGVTGDVSKCVLWLQHVRGQFSFKGAPRYLED